MKLLYSVLVVLFCVATVTASCDFPPSLWCSSESIAHQCNVYEQCKAASTVSSNADPVNVTLYYESLCPDCKRFFQTQLYKTWKALGNDVMSLTLVPYGNAREQKQGDKWIFQCQHGSQECIGNLIETCAIYLTKDIKVYFPFIYCMEQSNEEPAKAAAKCAKQQPQIDLASIAKCSNGQQGNDLEHQMALKTAALDPPHKYVPWVTINGVHTEKMEKEVERDILGVVCETYKGPTPAVCDKHLNWLDSRLCRN